MVTFVTSYLFIGPMIFSGPDAAINILAYAQTMVFMESLTFEIMVLGIIPFSLL